MTQLADVLDRARDAVTVRHVFGDPIERDGVLIIPVARVTSGGGGGAAEGSGDSSDGKGQGSGWGLGFGLNGEPVGVFVIKDGTVTWQPAFDVNQAIARGQKIFLAGLVLLRVLSRGRTKRKVAKLQQSG